jgi:hypothetical protein
MPTPLAVSISARWSGPAGLEPPLAGLSRVSTRRYLEYFVAAGKAAVRLRYGGTGRPERRYQWLGAA